MTISIIIPTYNEAKHIVNCLLSLKKQSLKPDEIIIVDDGSTDNTTSVLSKYQLLHQQHLGAGSARNHGAKQAKGDILVFVDADMEFSKNFLKDLVAPIISGKAIGTFSKNEFVANWYNPWARSWNYLRGLTSNRAIPEDFPNQSPVFRAILRSQFNKAGGFDTNRGYDDDWTLSEKLAVKASLAPNAKYYHFNPDSVVEIFRQARWQGSRQFKFKLIGKLFTMIKIIITPTLILPFWFAVRFRLPHIFIAKMAYDTGFLLGLIGSKKIK